MGLPHHLAQTAEHSCSVGTSSVSHQGAQFKADISRCGIAQFAEVNMWQHNVSGSTATCRCESAWLRCLGVCRPPPSSFALSMAHGGAALSV